MAHLHKCLVEGIVVRIAKTGLAEQIPLGAIVDFDRELTPGFTLGQAVDGIAGAFEQVKEQPHVGTLSASDQE
jgi:hypothetical protein